MGVFVIFFVFEEATQHLLLEFLRRLERNISRRTNNSEKYVEYPSLLLSSVQHLKVSTAKKPG